MLPEAVHDRGLNGNERLGHGLTEITLGDVSYSCLDHTQEGVPNTGAVTDVKQASPQYIQTCHT